MLARSALYWRTARHLKPRQVAHQILRRFQPLRAPPLPTVAPGTRTASLPPRFITAPPAMNAGPWSFLFLNIERSFPDGSVDWVCGDLRKLWRYNLHYFDYLNDPQRSAIMKGQILDHWIKNNPPGTPDAWEPYTASLRIVNWIKFFLSPAAPQCPASHWVASLGAQCAWLRHNVEFHLLGNHLFKNAKALLFAACYFRDPMADEWLRVGSRIMLAQLDEQFLADGGHFERSTMYHAIMVEDLLDLIALNRAVPRVLAAPLLDALIEKAVAALAFLQDLTFMDGQIALFNDAAFGIAPATQDLCDYAARLLGPQAASVRSSAGPVRRRSSGYYGWRGLRDGWLIDCGPVGPDYQPGHAHCDTLSYELLFDGRRLVVDTGVHDYEPGERRHRSRSTAGHNTVMVDGMEQSEIWDVFRVARRARVTEARMEVEAGRITFVGAHDGYRRLPGSVGHRRLAEYLPARSLLVEDEITGGGSHVMENRAHFAPGLQVSGSGRTLDVRNAGGETVARVEIGEGPSIHIEQAERYPEFGRTERIEVLRLRSDGRLPLRQKYCITRV